MSSRNIELKSDEMFFYRNTVKEVVIKNSNNNFNDDIIISNKFQNMEWSKY